MEAKEYGTGNVELGKANWGTRNASVSLSPARHEWGAGRSRQNGPLPPSRSTIRWQRESGCSARRAGFLRLHRGSLTTFGINRCAPTAAGPAGEPPPKKQPGGSGRTVLPDPPCPRLTRAAVNPNAEVWGSTPALGCSWMRPRIQPRGAHPARKNYVRFHATRDFSEGAENRTRGRVRSPFYFGVLGK